mmetsp:Transcript_68638/g.179967  ORF Transcript_68638/g.179967 Transcript_68638/m.179967 type:complete len:270 (-) Transcript_68638:58-867(-)
MMDVLPRCACSELELPLLCECPPSSKCRSLLLQEGNGRVVLVVQVRMDVDRRVVLGVVRVVGVHHPDPVRVPRQVVLRDPGATALRAAAVEVPRDRVGVLNALALPSGLHPLDGVALGTDANAACVLDDDHGGQRPNDQEGRDHPEGELLEPSPVRREVLGEVTPVDGVEDARRQDRPVLPVVAVVIDGLVQGVLLRGAVRLELHRRRRREVEEGREAAFARRRRGDALGGGAREEPGGDRPLPRQRLLSKAEQQHGRCSRSAAGNRGR